MNRKSIHSDNLELRYCVSFLSIPCSIIVEYMNFARHRDNNA